MKWDRAMLYAKCFATCLASASGGGGGGGGGEEAHKGKRRCIVQ